MAGNSNVVRNPKMEEKVNQTYEIRSAYPQRIGNNTGDLISMTCIKRKGIVNG